MTGPAPARHLAEPQHSAEPRPLGQPRKPGEGRLEGKVAIVAGAGSIGDGTVIGNGRATAVLFAREGARVVVADINPAAAGQTAELIAAEGGECVTVSADVTREADSAGLTRLALDTWGKLDILHHVVGGSSVGDVTALPDAEWDRLIDLNFRSLIFTTRHAVPAMAAGGGGSIITTSSISAIRPRGLTGYSAVKGAVMALTQAMAVDHGAQGIRVNCIVPGPMYTPNAIHDGMPDGKREGRRLASPLEIEGTGWDIAHAAVYLASDEARYVTGVILNVDGGVSLRTPSRG
jgi:NAD(P)-dependent dehydrogenase (short-subunit alcohol dehydrogenase family)